MITSVLIAAMLQTAAINSERDAYISCLEKSRESAKGASIGGDAFADYARQACSSVEQKLKAALIAFDMKNKVPRKQATADAQLQVEEFDSGEAQLYKRTAPKAQPAATAPAQATPAAQPKL